jgi:hypothetical protein
MTYKQSSGQRAASRLDELVPADLRDASGIVIAKHLPAIGQRKQANQSRPFHENVSSHGGPGVPQ